jgi:hypothetical protein
MLEVNPDLLMREGWESNCNVVICLARGGQYSQDLLAVVEAACLNHQLLNLRPDPSNLAVRLATSEQDEDLKCVGRRNHSLPTSPVAGSAPVSSLSI